MGACQNALGDAHWKLPSFLNLGKVFVAYGSFAQRLGEQVGGGDGVLNGEVDADASCGRHGVGRVAYAEQAGLMPLREAVDLDERSLISSQSLISDDAVGEKGRDLSDFVPEVVEAILLDLTKEPLADDEAGLEVIAAIDEDEGLAVVDVAEGVFGVAGSRPMRNQSDVDGDAKLDDLHVGGLPRKMEWRPSQPITRSA